MTSLDFQMLDENARVIVGLSGTQDFTVSQPQANMVVVDVPNAFLPQSLDNRGSTKGGRVLDTSRFVRFGSPVRLVRAYRTSSGARVAMTLSRSADHAVEIGEDGLVYIDIPLSLEEQDRWLNRGGEATSEVAPQESDSGIENAYRKDPEYIALKEERSACMWEAIKRRAPDVEDGIVVRRLVEVVRGLPFGCHVRPLRAMRDERASHRQAPAGTARLRRSQRKRARSSDQGGAGRGARGQVRSRWVVVAAVAKHKSSLPKRGTFL